MTKTILLAAAALGALTAQPALAQNKRTTQSGDSAAVAILNAVPADQQPDVVLDIPNLSVDEIALEVDNLQANVSLDARLASLLKLTAGADVSIDKVSLTIKGVQAKAALVVRLDNVKAIIDRTLQTIDNNPQILEQLTGTLDNTVNTVGGVANNAVGTVGNLTGTLLKSGAVLDIAKAGLSTVSKTVDAAGNTVQRLRGADGALYEVVTDTAGKILRSAKL